MPKPEDFNINQSNILGFGLKACSENKYYYYIMYLTIKKNKKLT